MELRVGALGLVNHTFPGDMDGTFARFEADMRALGRELDFEVVAAGRPFEKLEDVERFLGELRDRGIDFLVVQVCSISSGRIMEAIGRSGFPLGIWGIPEPAAEGPVRLNSICGLNMFCSILRTWLRHVPVSYQWFYGERTDPEFSSRIAAAVRSLRALKRLRKLRLGLVGGVAPGFLNVSADPRLLRARFGVEVLEYEFSDLKAAIDGCPADAALAREMTDEVDAVADEVKAAIPLHTRVYGGIRKFAEDNRLGALAISCWPKFRTELGMIPCAACGRLTDTGLVAACEGDVEGALSMELLASVAGRAPMIMDFTDIDREAGAILYWHCGNAPASCGKRGTVRLAPHFKPGSRVTCGDNVRVGTVYEMTFEPGEYTVLRLMADGSRCLLMSGEMQDGARGSGFDGTRGWLGALRYDGRELALPDLLETIMSEGVPHHHCLVKGNVVAEVAQCMRWAGVEIIRPVGGSGG